MTPIRLAGIATGTTRPKLPLFAGQHARHNNNNPQGKLNMWSTMTTGDMPAATVADNTPAASTPTPTTVTASATTALPEESQSIAQTDAPASTSKSPSTSSSPPMQLRQIIDGTATGSGDDDDDDPATFASVDHLVKTIMGDENAGKGKTTTTLLNTTSTAAVSGSSSGLTFEEIMKERNRVSLTQWCILDIVAKTQCRRSLEVCDRWLRA